MKPIDEIQGKLLALGIACDVINDYLFIQGKAKLVKIIINNNKYTLQTLFTADEMQYLGDTYIRVRNNTKYGIYTISSSPLCIAYAYTSVEYETCNLFTVSYDTGACKTYRLVDINGVTLCKFTNRIYNNGNLLALYNENEKALIVYQLSTLKCIKFAATRAIVTKEKVIGYKPGTVIVDKQFTVTRFYDVIDINITKQDNLTVTADRNIIYTVVDESTDNFDFKLSKTKTFISSEPVLCTFDWLIGVNYDKKDRKG